MKPVDYLKVLLRRWWVIVLVMVIAGGSAYLLTRRQAAVYRSTQLILIQPSRSDFGLTEASRLLLEPAVVYLNSTLRAQDIIDDLELPMTAQELKENTTIASDSLRMVIQVDVDTPDPQMGNDIAEAWGQEYVDFRREQNQQVARADRVEAILPDVPVSEQIAPQPLFSGVAGIILGLLLGVILVFVMEFLESGVIRRRDDLEKAVDHVSVLATIPDND